MRTSRLVRQLMAAARLLIAITVLAGTIYPLAITVAAQVIAPDRANGSRLVHDGRVVGSRLIAQPSQDPGRFWPRPSAAGGAGYDTLSSGATNLGPNNPALVTQVRRRRAEYARIHRVAAAEVPADAVTASASGLDPHISVRNAELQARRVARVTGQPVSEVLQLVAQATEGRTLGVLGEPRVNVLQLNLALER